MDFSYCPLVAESPRMGHAPPRYRRKRWPSEALMEGWFPLRSGEHVSLPIAKAAGSRERADDRISKAWPAEPVAALSHSGVPSRVAAGHRAAMKSRVDAGCHCTCMPATLEVSLDILLHGSRAKGRRRLGAIVLRFLREDRSARSRTSSRPDLG